MYCEFFGKLIKEVILWEIWSLCKLIPNALELLQSEESEKALSDVEMWTKDIIIRNCQLIEEIVISVENKNVILK